MVMKTQIAPHFMHLSFLYQQKDFVNRSALCKELMLPLLQALKATPTNPQTLVDDDDDDEDEDDDDDEDEEEKEKKMAS